MGWGAFGPPNPFLDDGDLGEVTTMNDEDFAAMIAMLAYWCAGFAHPLKDVVVECAWALIDRRPISVAHALRVMDDIAHHKGQWGALPIPLYACDDVDDIADARFAAIRSAWEQNG